MYAYPDAISPGSRKCKQKSRSRAQFAFRPNLASMRLNNVLHDRQPKPGSTCFTRASLVHSVKALEDSIKMLRGNARAKILHSELDSHASKACAPTRMRLPSLAYLSEFSIRFPNTWFIASGSAITTGLAHPAIAEQCRSRPPCPPALRWHRLASHWRGPLHGKLVVGAFNTGKREEIFGKAVHSGGIFENDAEKITWSFPDLDLNLQ